jgi:prepilin-type N-terminal cleavage/methylation domain-containing protein
MGADRTNMRGKHKRRICRTSGMRQQGLSLMEMLISLTIIALLLSATMLAIDASFTAYAAAAKSASTQTTTRLAVHRLLKLIRTSTLHGPVSQSVPSDAEWSDWPAMLSALDEQLQARRNVGRPEVNPTKEGTFTLTSRYFRIWGPKGNQVVLTYVDATDEIWLTTLKKGASEAYAQPLLGGVTDATFTLHRRLNEEGMWVLERGSATLDIVANDDTTMELGKSADPTLHVQASTMPRKLN